jgi:outer membrane protein assembly factor BamD
LSSRVAGDYTNSVQAEEAYRLMLQQFPDSVLIPQAKQRLREVPT